MTRSARHRRRGSCWAPATAAGLLAPGGLQMSPQGSECGCQLVEPQTGLVVALLTKRVFPSQARLQLLLRLLFGAWH